MAKDYEQMEIDVTLESDRDLKDNMQVMTKFALGQLMEYKHPDPVKNRHEGYGIAAEGYSALAGRVKMANGDMQTMLKLLPNGDSDIINVIGSLYNSCVDIAVEAVKLAAQSQRILNDLYYGDSKTPLEEYLEESEGDAEEDGFEEATDGSEETEDAEEESAEDESEEE